MFWHWTASEPEAKGGEATGQHLQFHHKDTDLSLSPAFQELINDQHTAHHAVCPLPSLCILSQSLLPHRIGPLVISLEKLVLRLQAFTHLKTSVLILLWNCMNTAVIVCSCYPVVWTLQRDGGCLSPLPCRPMAHDTVTGPLHMRTCTSDVSMTREVPLMSKANMGYRPSHNLNAL